MPDYSWPDAEHRILIGKRISRVDSPFKVSGRAKYTYDYHAPDMLFGKVVRSPYAKAKIVSIDTSAAEKMPGVKAIEIVQKPGSTVQWAGDEVVAVAALDEGTAEDAARAITVQYHPANHMVSDAEPPAGAGDSAGPMNGDDIDDAINNQLPDRQFIEYLQQHGVTFHVEEDDIKDWKGAGASDAVIDAIRKAEYHEVKGGGGHSAYQKAAAQTMGDPDKAFASADVVSEGLYGASVITHCCLESHGSVAEWPSKDHLMVHISTQNVSGVPAQMADPLGVPAANIRIHQDNMGGASFGGVVALGVAAGVVVVVVVALGVAAGVVVVGVVALGVAAGVVVVVVVVLGVVVVALGVAAGAVVVGVVALGVAAGAVVVVVVVALGVAAGVLVVVALGVAAGVPSSWRSALRPGCSSSWRSALRSGCSSWRGSASRPGCSSWRWRRSASRPGSSRPGSTRWLALSRARRTLSGVAGQPPGLEGGGAHGRWHGLRRRHRSRSRRRGGSSRGPPLHLVHRPRRRRHSRHPRP